jgi:isomerase DpgB
MRIDHELPEDLGIAVRVDGSAPLPQITSELEALCERAEDNGDGTVLILRMSDAAPADRGWPTRADLRAVNRWERVLRRLRRVPTATVWAADGTCAGASLDLLLATDFHVCTPDMRLLLPVNDGQFWPGTAIHALSQLIGLAKARQIVLWGEDLSASRAQELGLVDRIEASLDQALYQAAVLLGRVADAELAVRRALLNEAMSSSFDDALGVHLAACDRELLRLRSGSDLTPDVRG